MNSITPVTVPLPNGIERPLRWSIGARRRIIDTFGGDFGVALERYGDACLPGVMHAMFHDEKGKLLAGIPANVSEFEEMFPSDMEMQRKYFAAVYEAMSQGRIKKTEVEEALERQNERAMSLLTARLIGLNSPPSASNGSASSDENSGGDFSNAKSSPESTSMAESSGNGTSDSEQSAPAL